jgi:hypothetical protein
LSDQKAKEHRAKQTVNNLLLSLLVSVAMVVVVVLIVPRDDSSRIPHVNYQAIAAQASTASKHNVIAPNLPKGWWSNQATWSEAPIDAVPRFEAGFVGPKNQYIGMTQAFGVNPTWLALSLKDVVQEKNYSNPGSSVVWAIYKTPEPHNPPKTRDVIWIAQFGNDAVLLYGDGSVSEFKTFTKTIESKLGDD